MKAFKLYCLLAIIILLASCSKNDDNGDNNNQLGLANFQTTCTNGNGNSQITGPTGAYWEYAKGNNIPLNRLPILKNPQLTNYSHSNRLLPPLVIVPPVDYQASDYINNSTQAHGMQIIRNDGFAVWRYVPTSDYQLNSNPDFILETEIKTVTNAFGFNGEPTTICDETKVTQIPGLTIVFRARLIEFGNIRALIWINALPSSFSTIVSSSVSAGLSNEFDTLVTDIFLPLSYQLLINDNGSLSDRDGDGTPDIYDSEPDNPNVQ